MASYLSYFTSNNATQSQQQRPSTPSSTWSSTFSSRLSSLRKALTKDSEEDDPENEDCSHVSNVLRAYYTEKGRPFPQWLPPDPKKPAPIMPQQPSQYGNYGGQYGGYGSSQYASQPVHGRGGSGGRAGLSDLWDPSPHQAAAPAPQSLRLPRSTPQSLRSQDSGSSAPVMSGNPSYTAQISSTSRPLPSQRAGSYQNTVSATATAMGSRDRLRARLQGGERSSSPLRSAESSRTYSGTTNFGSETDSPGASPYVSATQPWSGGSNDFAPGGGYSDSTGYGGSRHRPGGPR